MRARLPSALARVRALCAWRSRSSGVMSAPRVSPTLADRLISRSCTTNGSSRTLEQPVGQRAQAVEVLDVLGDDEELVGAQPHRGVLHAGAPAQPVGDLAEQQVAGLVAEGLVDRLEAVDVQVHQADLQPAAAGERDRVAQPVGQRAAVGQPGQRVGERAADEVLLRAAAVGDVDQREDDELRRRRCCGARPRATARPTARCRPTGAAAARRPGAGSGRARARPAPGSRPRSPTGGSSGWASRSTCRPASSSAVRPVRAHIIGLATRT